MKGSIIAIVFTIVLALLVDNSAAQYTKFTATFTVTAPSYSGGVFTGKMYYDWDFGGLLLKIDAGVQELYLFNDAKGYPTNETFNSQFSSQYGYTSSDLCPCETSALLYAMPILFDLSVEGVTVPVPCFGPSEGTITTFPLGPALTYPALVLTYAVSATVTSAYNEIINLYITKAGVPCGFLFRDERLFTFQTITPGPFDTSVFTAPTGCVCGKPIDIVFTLDRTGSIQVWEWYIEHAFVKNVSLAFDYGPLKTNLGIMDWNSIFWTTINLLDGITQEAVSTAIDAMGCCSGSYYDPNNVYSSCCCCGTPIGGGLYMGAQMMLTSNRPTATKVMMLLTDGCQNHVFSPPVGNNAPVVTACPCGSEIACQTDATCVADITTYYDYCATNLPQMTIIVVGVGGPGQICTAQLLRAAGNIQQNVFNPTAWDELSGFVTNIAALTCAADASNCTNCCGICSCGTCIKAPACTASTNLCQPNVIDPNSQCCTPAPPITCPNDNPCLLCACLSSAGCVYQNKTCPDPSHCYEWSCNQTAGQCASRLKTTDLPADCSTVNPPPECNTTNAATNCNDSNACTIPSCNNGNCVWNTAPIPPNDECSQWSCNPVSGNYISNSKVCDDHNACTNDSCDPLTGCKFVNITCPVPADGCKISVCDTLLGCLVVQNPCTSVNITNCTIPSCANNTCYAKWSCANPPQAGVEALLPVTTVVAVTVATGAIVGIIIGIVLLFAALGGAGAYAYSQAAGGGGATVVANNPLFVANGAGGGNPLYKPN
jgi:hypothetical protein